MLVVTMRCALLKLWSISGSCQFRVSLGQTSSQGSQPTLECKGNRLLKFLELFGQREIPRRRGTGARHVGRCLCLRGCQQRGVRGKYIMT